MERLTDGDKYNTGWLKTCDNICQRNMSTKRIYEAKIINNWQKHIKKNIQTDKEQRWHMEN